MHFIFTAFNPNMFLPNAGKGSHIFSFHTPYEPAISQLRYDTIREMNIAHGNSMGEIVSSIIFPCSSLHYCPLGHAVNERTACERKIQIVIMVLHI